MVCLTSRVNRAPLRQMHLNCLVFMLAQRTEYLFNIQSCCSLFSDPWWFKGSFERSQTLQTTHNDRLWHQFSCCSGCKWTISMNLNTHCYYFNSSSDYSPHIYSTDQTEPGGADRAAGHGRVGEWLLRPQHTCVQRWCLFFHQPVR